MSSTYDYNAGFCGGKLKSVISGSVGGKGLSSQEGVSLKAWMISQIRKRIPPLPDRMDKPRNFAALTAKHPSQAPGGFLQAFPENL